MKYTIIYGVQTGVDQAALHAAKEIGLNKGGYIGRNYVTEDG